MNFRNSNGFAGKENEFETHLALGIVHSHEIPPPKKENK